MSSIKKGIIFVLVLIIGFSIFKMVDNETDEVKDHALTEVENEKLTEDEKERITESEDVYDKYVASTEKYVGSNDLLKQVRLMELAFEAIQEHGGILDYNPNLVVNGDRLVKLTELAREHFDSAMAFALSSEELTWQQYFTIVDYSLKTDISDSNREKINELKYPQSSDRSMVVYKFIVEELNREEYDLATIIQMAADEFNLEPEIVNEILDEKAIEAESSRYLN